MERLPIAVFLLFCAVTMVTGCTRFDINKDSKTPSRQQSEVNVNVPIDDGMDDTASPKFFPTNEKVGNIRSKRHVDSQLHSHTLYVNIFRKSDTNGDGFITREEYKENNPDTTDNDTQIVMEVYDKNGDNKVSQKEFLRESNVGFFAHFEASHAADCDVIALNQCAIDFINVVRLTADDDIALCNGLQAYVDCISRQLIPSVCESLSFTNAVFEIVTSFQADEVCPSIDVNYLLTLSSTQRLRRHARDQDTPKLKLTKGLETTKCGVSDIMACDRDFIQLLRQDTDPCNSLLDYRRCIHRSTRMCDDVTAYRLRDGLKQVTGFYRHLGLCHKTPESL